METSFTTLEDSSKAPISSVCVSLDALITDDSYFSKINSESKPIDYCNGIGHLIQLLK